jgi:hypothetical protein
MSVVLGGIDESHSTDAVDELGNALGTSEVIYVHQNVPGEERVLTW